MDRLDGAHEDRSHPARTGLPGGQAVRPLSASAERSVHPAPTEPEAQPARTDDLWETVFSRENLMRALQRVENNRGAPGVDGMTVAELQPWLKVHWPEIRQALDEGRYRPRPVRRVTIPKPDGGARELGVPTVLDRLVQQATAQVLTSIIDPTFSEHSFGFRPGRSAHQAVKAARGYIAEGYRWVVDVDLERFFDRVQHDVLMARVARRVKDRRLLRLVRRYLEAGIMVSGVKQSSAGGTPQGSPLSPLLSNILLDDLDRELERRGHQRYVRYADDVRVHVQSRRAGERVLSGITEFVERHLKLRVNKEKSSVHFGSKATMLGFGFALRRTGEVSIRVSPKAAMRLHQRLRWLTRRVWRIAMSERLRQLNRYILGWCGYFALAEQKSLLVETDAWLRRRLRQVRWVEWKVPSARRRNLIALGARQDQATLWASSARGSWRMANSPPLSVAMSNAYWRDLGLITLQATVATLRRS